MSEKNKLLNKIQNLDEEFKLCDYSVKELEDLLAIKKNKKFKEQYFEFYDDVKSSSLKKQDW